MRTPRRTNPTYAILCLLAFALPVFAQDSEPAPADTVKTESGGADESSSTSSQEVEINEDTYRQFMELKDANRPGDIIPETVYKPGSGLQKLDKLPEESQKHLRNELRGIIVQGDPWQPGDENAEYPYTPSEAASKNPALQKQEKEAWGELVDSYNQREAQIYADSAGNRAAMRSQEGKGEQPGGGSDSEGKDGEDKEGVAGRPSQQESTADQDDTAGAFSPDTVHDPNAQSASGVPQNALEFLQGLGGGENTGAPQGDGPQQNAAGSQGQANASAQEAARQAANAAASASGNPANASDAGSAQNALEFLQQANTGTGQDSGQATAQNSGQETAEGDQQAEGEDAGEQGEGQSGSQEKDQALAGQQTESPEKKISIPIPDNNMTLPASEPEEESTAGATQNALEFLQGESAQSGDGQDDAKETGTPPTGTLNIQDLLNAQGVGGQTGTDAQAPVPEDEKPTDENGIDKDGGARQGPEGQG